MKVLRYFFLILLILCSLVEIVICSIAFKTKNESVYDYDFSSFSRKNINDFEITLFDENIRITQPFVAQGKKLNSLILFFRYHTPPQISENGKIIVSITDENETIISEAIINCDGIPTEDWFGWKYDFDVSLIPENKYFINLIAVDTQENIFELRTGSSNPAIATHYYDIIINGRTQDNRILVLSATYTKTMTPKIPIPYQNALRISSILLFIIIIEFLFVCILSIYRNTKQITRKSSIVICIFVLVQLTILSVFIYKFASPWYVNVPPVAHALGAINEDAYTNSKEAFSQSIDIGFYFLETDFSTTADGHIVLKHDWGNKESGMGFPSGYIPTLEEFKNHTIREKYTPLSLLDLLDLMDQNPNIYIITDSKEGDYDTVVTQFTYLVNTAKEHGYENLLNHFIIQIYNDDMFYAVNSVYPFDKYIYTLYQRGYNEIDQLIDFCRQNDIYVVTIFDLWWNEQPDVKQALCDSGLTIYVHTINDETEAKKIMHEGASNIYTDYINPHHL